MKRVYSLLYFLIITLSACSGGSDNTADTNTNPDPDPDPTPVVTPVVTPEGDYRLHIKDSDSLLLSDLTTDTGHSLKIMDTATRIVVIDYENSRILFYTKSTTLETSEIISIVGTHSNTNNTNSFGPQTNNKFNTEFSGIIHNDKLWVTNYTYGEILCFDLNGNLLSSQPGKFTHLDSDSTNLYAFEGTSIYTYSELDQIFNYSAELPISTIVDKDDYLYRRGAIHVGYDRLAILDFVSSVNTLRVFDLSDLLSGTTTEIMNVADAKSFAILSDKIVWSTVYTSNLEYCDLNGLNCGTGTFSVYLYSFRHTHGSDNMYIVGSWGIQVLNTQLAQVELMGRAQYYWSGTFFGGDNDNLYFYDFRDGGFAFASLDLDNHIAVVDPTNEIAYSGWHRNVRIKNGFAFLQSEYPTDSFTMHVFDLINKTSSNFAISNKQGFESDEQFIYILNGLTIQVYTHQGILDHEITLTNLDNSNLLGFTSTSVGMFAKNSNNFFIAYNSKLNVFTATGEFVENHDLAFSTVNDKTMLFADDNRILLNYPLSIFDLSTNLVSDFPDPSATRDGFVFGDKYWFASDYNQYSVLGF